MFKEHVSVVEWLLYDRGVAVTPADWPTYRRDVLDTVLARIEGTALGDSEVVQEARRCLVALRESFGTDE